jgi:hypothetical protein
MPRAFSAGLVTPDSRRAGEKFAPVPVLQDMRASVASGRCRLGGWSPALSPEHLETMSGNAGVALRVLGVSSSLSGVPIGKWQTVAWDPQRFLAPYAERFIEELLTYSPRNYPNRDLTQRVPLMPRPKDSLLPDEPRLDRVACGCRAEMRRAARVEGCLVPMSLEHPRTRHRADLRASQFLEHGDTPLFMCAARRFRDDEDQLGRVSWVTRRIGHGDLAAK